MDRLLNDSLPTLLGTGLFVGTVSHRVVFMSGEWHKEAPWLVVMYLASIPILGFLIDMIVSRPTSWSTFTTSSILAGSWLLGIFLSMSVYRLFFHRLAGFPGPKIAALSKLWHAWHCLGGKNYLFLQKLHDQYGPVVRTGPSELTVFTPDVLVKLNGPGNNNLKSAWYDILLPEFGVATIRDRQFHDQRRRFWVNGFSGKEMIVYQERIKEHTKALAREIQRLSEQDGKVDFKSLAYWFSFDIMGLFAFDRSFNMISSPEWRYAVNMLRRAFSIVAPVSPVPWLAHIGFTFLRGRWVVASWHGMIDWCRDRMLERVDTHNTSIRDISARLVENFVKGGRTAFNNHLLCGESIVAIVAGSDTVGSASCFLFYELAKHPEHQQAIREELKTVDSIENVNSLLGLPHLAACINETLRFHHVIPTGGYRDTPPSEGLIISDTWIPPDTTVIAPRYILNRLDSAFEKPNEWIPERWTTKPDMVRDRRTHQPFAMGRYACPGKPLALSELSYLTATLLLKYQLRFPDGDDGWRVEAEMIDQFTALPGPLDLVFERLDN